MVLQRLAYPRLAAPHLKLRSSFLLFPSVPCSALICPAMLRLLGKASFGMPPAKDSQTAVVAERQKSRGIFYHLLKYSIRIL